ncbi:SDR family NAD(P)-dependent oxidoreductase, partial [Cronobacter sakazakii]|nr:SDR family NAD(P)-dependent oxidoreductase [Cronobacter sakazakii]
KQPAPGIQAKMEPVPDCGEKSYKGSGRLQDRKALVTGGDSGIGRAAAIAYAREGADVVLNYLPEEQQDAEEVKALIEEAGRKAVLIPGDLTDEKFARDLVHRAIQELGGLDILALVAGKQTAVEDIANLTSEQFQKTYATNVFALFWITQEALPHLKPGASIITTSSIQAYQPS